MTTPVPELTFDEPPADEVQPAPFTSSFHIAFVPLVALLGAWWLYSSGPVALRGIESTYESIAVYVGNPSQITEETQLILWILITGLKEGTQLVVHWCWRWFTKSWERLGTGIIILLVTVLFAVVDIALTGAGWYVLFKPLDLRNIDWLLAGGSAALGLFGGLFAQIIALHFVGKWYQEWKEGRKHGSYGQHLAD